MRQQLRGFGSTTRVQHRQDSTGFGFGFEVPRTRQAGSSWLVSDVVSLALCWRIQRNRRLRLSLGSVWGHWGENWSTKTIDLGMCCANLISWRSRATPCIVWRPRNLLGKLHASWCLESTRAFAYCGQKRLQGYIINVSESLLFRLPCRFADFLSSGAAIQLHPCAV